MIGKILPVGVIMLLVMLSCQGAPDKSGLSESEAREFDSLISFVNKNKTQTDKADTLISCFNRIFAFPAEELSHTQRIAQINCYRGAMGAYLIKGRLEDAIIANLEGNSQAHEMGENEIELRSTMGMLNIVSGLRMTELTDQYRRSMLELLKKSTDTLNIVEALLVGAGSYTNENKADSALALFQQLDRFMAGDSTVLDHSANGRYLYAFEKGWLYSEILDSAQAAVKVLMPIYEQYRPVRAVFPGYEMVCLNIAKSYEHAGDQLLADKYYDEATDLVCDYPSFLRFEAVDWLQKNYIGKRDDKNTLMLLPMFMSLQEQFYNYRNASMFSVYNAQYRLAEKNHQIELQQRELERTRWRVFFLIGVVVLLLALCVWGLLFWRDRKRKLRVLFTAILDRQRQWQHMLTANGVVAQLPGHEVENTDETRTEDYAERLTAEHYQRIINVMEKERPFVNPEFNIENLSRLAGLNRSVTSRAINTMSGQNFSNWLAGYRVNYLIELYIKTEASESSMETLYEKAGFSSRSSYYRQFKAVTGMTPRQFREQYNREKE